MSNDKPKNIVFFIDGGTWDLLDPWIADGKLSNFAEIKNNGAFGALESVIPTITSFATAAFYLGKNPARIGIFNFSDLEAEMVSSDKFSGKRLWEYLSDEGLRSLVVDIPSSWPPRPFNGVLFTGFFTPSEARDFVYPSTLVERFSDYPRGGMEILNYLRGEFGELKTQEFKVTKKRWDTFYALLNEDQFDFGIFYVKGSDMLQHYFWQDKKLLLKFYELLDKFLGELLQLEGLSNIFVISDHGFEEAPKTTFFINTFLQSKGYLQFKGWQVNTLIGRMIKAFLENHRMLARFFYQTKNQIISLLTFFLLKFSYYQSKDQVIREIVDVSKNESTDFLSNAIDMNNTRVFAPGGSLRGKGLYINRKLITNENEYKKIIAELTEHLSSLKYNGRKIIKVLRSGTKEYGRLESANIPDIVFLPVTGIFVNDRFSPTIFGLRKTASRASGHHLSSLEGIFLAKGKDIKSGKYDGLRLIDIFPTILKIYGIMPPDDIDGTAIDIILSESSKNMVVQKREKSRQNLEKYNTQRILDAISI